MVQLLLLAATQGLNQPPELTQTACLAVSCAVASPLIAFGKYVSRGMQMLPSPVVPKVGLAQLISKWLPSYI